MRTVRVFPRICSCGSPVDTARPRRFYQCRGAHRTRFCRSHSGEEHQFQNPPNSQRNFRQDRGSASHRPVEPVPVRGRGATGGKAANGTKCFPPIRREQFVFNRPSDNAFHFSACRLTWGRDHPFSTICSRSCLKASGPNSRQHVTREQTERANNDLDVSRFLCRLPIRTDVVGFRVLRVSRTQLIDGEIGWGFGVEPTRGEVVENAAVLFLAFRGCRTSQQNVLAPVVRGDGNDCLTGLLGEVDRWELGFFGRGIRLTPVMRKVPQNSGSAAAAHRTIRRKAVSASAKRGLSKRY